MTRARVFGQGNGQAGKVARSAGACRIGRSALVLAVAVTLGYVASVPQQAHAQAADRAFTVGNYPVEASAVNAVAAKERALADGQQAAFRSLLKRLVPVTAYGDLKRLAAVKAADFATGVSVRQERNSSTRYIATLDFSYDANGVRDLLRREGVAFVDAQAPQTKLITVYRAPTVAAGGPAAGGKVPDALQQASGTATWADVWGGLDLTRTLSPVQLVSLKASIHPDTVNALATGELGAERVFATEYGTERLVLAIVEPDLQTNRLNVTLAGQDAVGPIRLKQAFRFSPGETTYALELAAVVSLGILEGRWKATQAGLGGSGPSARALGPLQPVQVTVEFTSMGQWRAIEQQIAGVPGVQNMQVGGLWARGADIALRFPGGGEALAAALAQRGQILQNAGGIWILR